MSITSVDTDIPSNKRRNENVREDTDKVILRERKGHNMDAFTRLLCIIRACRDFGRFEKNAIFIPPC